MATSPTTSALGALGDLGRPAAAKTAARPGDAAEKSRFSDVFHDAQGGRPESQQRPAADKTAGAEPRADAEKAVVARTRTAAPGGNKSAAAAAAPAATGKELPPAGESLPLTLEQLLTDMAGDTAPSTSDGDDGSADGAAEDVCEPLPATPGIVLVMPENSVTAAAAALASRPGQAIGDDGQPAAVVGDVTATQKREIPAASQTLNPAMTLPGDTPSIDTAAAAAMPTSELPSTDSALRSKWLTDQKSEAVAPADRLPAEQAVAVVGANAAAVATVAAGANPVGEKVVPEWAGQDPTLNKTAGVKMLGEGGGSDKNAAALTFGDDTTLAALADGEVASIPEMETETERGTFRDTLKQLDSTLGTATPRSDTAPVATARDSGLRQYLDSSAVAAKVDVPVGKAGWSDAVAGKVMWMSSQNLSSAEIQMNPADLGPLSVRVSSHQDQTSIYFTSPHAAVREALDQSLPRLREMMGNQGIQLQDVGVGGQGSMREQHAFNDGTNNGNNSSSRGRGGRDADIDTDIGSVTRASTVLSRPGLLDAYA